jgi:hypothetical protein
MMRRHHCAQHQYAQALPMLLCQLSQPPNAMTQTKPPPHDVYVGETQPQAKKQKQEQTEPLMLANYPQTNACPSPAVKKMEYH